MTMAKRPTRINKSRGPEQAFPPMLGEHSEQVLRSLGYNDADVAKLLGKA